MYLYAYYYTLYIYIIFIHIIYNIYYYILLASVNCITWVAVLVVVQDELGPAKWYWQKQLVFFSLPQPFSLGPQALNHAHTNPYSHCCFQSIVSTSCWSKVVRLGWCRGSWIVDRKKKAGLILRPTHQRTGKIALIC